MSMSYSTRMHFTYQRHTRTNTQTSKSGSLSCIVVFLSAQQDNGLIDTEVPHLITCL